MISWTGRVRNEEVIQREEYTTNNIKRKGNLINHILCRNCFLKQVIEEKIEGRMEVTGRREEEVSSY